MLIHESAQKKVHDKTRQVVEMALTKVKRDFNNQVYADRLDRLLVRISGFPLVPEIKASINNFKAILLAKPYEVLEDIIEKIKIAVINSDAGKEDVSSRPVSDEDYDLHPLWIIIGGDIVGRGVTLPTLVTTYHLRNSSKSNFDTVMQQLRICGYRTDYSHMLRFYTTEAIQSMLGGMAFTDMVLWAQIKDWDEQNIDLQSEENLVYFTSSSRAKYDPTRKSVQDSNTISESFAGDKRVMFSLRNIFGSENFGSNIKFLTEQHQEKGNSEEVITFQGEEWIRISGIDSLIANEWASSGADKKRLKMLSSLYALPKNNPFLADRHIDEYPSTLLFPKRLISLSNYLDSYNWPNAVDSLLMSSVKSLYTYNSRLHPTSQVEIIPSTDGESLRRWVKESGLATRAPQEVTSSDYFNDLRMISPHIGTPQRSIVDQFGDGLTMLVEPVFATEPKGQGASGNKIAIGLALSGLYPAGQINEGIDLRITMHGEE
jgi:hypothetical protein